MPFCVDHSIFFKYIHGALYFFFMPYVFSDKSLPDREGYISVEDEQFATACIVKKSAAERKT